MRAFFHVVAIVAVLTSTHAFAQEGEATYEGVVGAADSSGGSTSFYAGGQTNSGGGGDAYDPYGGASPVDPGASIYGDVAKAGTIYGDGKQATDLYGYVEDSDVGQTAAGRRAVAARKAQEAREQQTVELKSQKEEVQQRYRDEAALKAQEHAAKMQAYKDAAGK